MNTDPGAVILAFGAGLALGCFYFGGLWLTVRTIHRSPRPGRRLLKSFIMRAVPTMAAFWWLTRLDILFLLAGLTGFFLVRTAATRIRLPRLKEDGHAA